MENSLRKLVKQFERDPTVGSLDTDLVSRYSSRVGGMAQIGRCQRVVLIPVNSIENSLQKDVKTFERDPAVGFLKTDLLSRYSSFVGGMASTVHHRRVDPIPRNSMKKSLQKLVKQFERDPTVEIGRAHV